MTGTNATTGKPLSGVEHLQQSIRDILSTPLGSRVMRRDYGSNLFKLIDNPSTAALVPLLTAATGEALARWEPRFKFKSLRLLKVEGVGKLTLEISGSFNAGQLTTSVSF